MSVQAAPPKPEGYVALYKGKSPITLTEGEDFIQEFIKYFWYYFKIYFKLLNNLFYFIIFIDPRKTDKPSRYRKDTPGI